MAKLGLNDETKPIGAFLFVGPSGVGKTEIAKQLASNMGIDFLRFDMSEYMESHSAAKLIGAPAGYVGYEDGGLLIEQVRNHPHSVLLFDEIEKAHPSVFDVFLQMLDNGMMKDNRGRVADFRNTVIIMTSNAGNTNPTPKVGFNQTNEACRTTSIEALKKIMRPELLGRLSEENIVQFNKLSDEVARKVAKKELKLLTLRMKSKGFNVTYSDDAISELVKLGVSDKYGAREMQKAIETNIKRMVTRKILNDSMPTRCVVVFKNGKFDIEEAQVIDIPEAMSVVQTNP
jgi:ATP-dependent Clp protease ATP-binding subunit ClpA